MKATYSERNERQGVALVMGKFESLGFAFRKQEENDYGIDGHAELIESERPTGQVLGLQIKSGPSYFSERTKDYITFRVDADHAKYWLQHVLPVIVCLCDLESQTIYWKLVTSNTLIDTGKGFKLEIPIHQVLEQDSIPILKDALTPLVSSDRYTIFKTEDSSHVQAKRYAYRVVINGTVSRAEIASIVRQVTTDGVKRRYHRNHWVEGRWGDSDAHVVWTFIYLSAEDEARNNFICQSLWINESLEQVARPFHLNGENIGSNIQIKWNDDYQSMAHLMASNTFTKEEYLSLVVPYIEDSKKLLITIDESLSSLKAREISEKIFLKNTNESRKKLGEIYAAISATSLAPFECKELDTSLQSYVAYLDNIVIFFSKTGLEKWDEPSRLAMALQQCWEAKEKLKEVNYELKKIL